MPAVARCIALAAAALMALAACGGDGASDAARRPSVRPRDTVVMYVAASLARPARDAADDFTRRTGALVLLESGGSVEHARKLTELGRVPDVLLLADLDVFPQLLVPAHAGWYAAFARNRMVVAYRKGSHGADEITPDNWWRVLARPNVEVGRPDPARAPAGYRALLVLALAERYYAQPGLARNVLARAGTVRPDAADLAALLELGEIDYILEYESLARARGFQFVSLPPAIDLGDPAHAADYARATVRVPGKTPAESTTVHGAPILYALSVPRRAPHPDAAARFAAFLLGADAARHFRDAHVDLLPVPRLEGTDVPAAVRDVAGADTSAPR